MSKDATPPADPKIIVTIEGEEVTLHVSDLTHADAAALRQQSHGAWRMPTLWGAIFETDPPSAGLEELAAVVFLARRQEGGDEKPTYDAIAATLTARSSVDARFDGFTFDDATAPEVVDSPPS